MDEASSQTNVEGAGQLSQGLSTARCSRGTVWTLVRDALLFSVILVFALLGIFLFALIKVMVELLLSTWLEGWLEAHPLLKTVALLVVAAMLVAAVINGVRQRKSSLAKRP